MDVNERIARWAGVPEPVPMEKIGAVVGTLFSKDGPVLPDNLRLSTTWPDYQKSDAAAMTLLPVLVERGYTFRLYYTKESGYDFAIWGEDEWLDMAMVGEASQPTIFQAITAAVCALIDKELTK